MEIIISLRDIHDEEELQRALNIFLLVPGVVIRFDKNYDTLGGII